MLGRQRETGGGGHFPYVLVRTYQNVPLSVGFSMFDLALYMLIHTFSLQIRYRGQISILDFIFNVNQGSKISGKTSGCAFVHHSGTHNTFLRDAQN